MTPLELIEDGIQTGDMTKVAEGYKYLTGKVVEVVSPSAEFPAGNHILEWYSDKANYSISTGAIPVMLDCGARARGEIPVEATKPKCSPTVVKPAKPNKVTATKSKKTTTKPEPPPPRSVSVIASEATKPKNKFVDNLTEAVKDLKSTRWINKNLNPVERRPPNDDTTVSVMCDNCENNFKCLKSEVRVAKPKRGGSDDDENNIGAENICPRCLNGR